MREEGREPPPRPPEAPPPVEAGAPRAPNDFGLGARVAQQSQQRFLNRDGTFNVRRVGLSYLESLSLYHALLTTSWPRFIAFVGGIYLAYNLLFAVGYFLCGPDALAGASGHTPAERLAEAFFFSVHTSATIGYGSISPRGTAANLLVTLEAFFGLLSLALATGVLFSRFARPSARITFSRQAVVAPYQAGTGFMFRIANARSNQLIDVHATVSMGWRDPAAPAGRRFHELGLERAQVAFFPLHWVVVHPIDAASPLWGITAEEFAARDAEIFILLTAVDETFEQTVHARSSYKPQEVAWGARFSDMFVNGPDGRVAADMRKLHDIEPAALPPAGARATAG